MKGSVQPLWWFSVVCLPCSVALAAKKETVRDLPVDTTACAEYGAFLKLARFAPSVDQKKAVESLFGQLREQHITIRPSLCKVLALADRDQLVPLCKKTALFFSHVDNSRVKNSGCLSSMIRRKKHIRDFICQEDSDLAMLAVSPCLLSVTGMCNNRGVPLARAVKSLLAWSCWQSDGQFNHGLFRSFSGMFCGKGLPIEADVNAILSWSVWQEGGQFNHDLFRSFSSMFTGKRLPKEQEVKAILSWPCWQVSGQFSSELFRSFSSMFSSKGLPKEAHVKAMLAWPCWQVNGQFNHELFRSFSSMLNSKGLPKEADVKAILGCPGWQVNNQFNLDLFRSFSSDQTHPCLLYTSPSPRDRQKSRMPSSA